jgi:trimeric autotransporter adhesin
MRATSKLVVCAIAACAIASTLAGSISCSIDRVRFSIPSESPDAAPDGSAAARCGDGVVDSGEVCDDGANAIGDGCDLSCRPSTRVYAKASNTQASDFFGWSVALSADGTTMAVGAYQEASGASGVNGDQADNSAGQAGAVYVFTLGATGWIQQAYLKASNPNQADFFGHDVALSADGSTLVVGAPLEDSSIPREPADDDAPDAGAVYVFARTGATWRQQAYVKASANRDIADIFGLHVALSSDGNTLAVGSPGEDSSTGGINTDPGNNRAASAGAAWVYTRTGEQWSGQAYVKASNPEAGDLFGSSVALSGDGDTLAVGATGEASAATGVDPGQGDNTAPGAGAVYVYVRTGATWRQQSYVKAINSDADDSFGHSVALSGDGSTLAVGALNEDSAAKGIGGDPVSDTTDNAGAVYVLTRTAGTWRHQAYVKASNTDSADFFGTSVALSADGSRLAASSSGEDSRAALFGGDQSNNELQSAGAAYLFARDGVTWRQQSYVKASNPDMSDQFGIRLALSADSGTVAVAAYAESSSSRGIGGKQDDNEAVFSGAVYVYR